jgi:hypothetical protein
MRNSFVGFISALVGLLLSNFAGATGLGHTRGIYQTSEVVLVAEKKEPCQNPFGCQNPTIRRPSVAANEIGRFVKAQDQAEWTGSTTDLLSTINKGQPPAAGKQILDNYMARVARLLRTSGFKVEHQEDERFHIVAPQKR